MLSFHEVFKKIPRARRTDRFKVLVALAMLRATTRANAVETAAVARELKTHLRSAAPQNVTDALRKATPHVEAVSNGERTLKWRLTAQGTAKLIDATGVDVIALDGIQPVLELSALHPAIQAAAKPRLESGQYADAVGRAVKELNQLVRTASKRTSDEGVRMMQQVFATDAATPRLHIGPVEQQWERDRQDGFRFIMAGVQQGIANVDKHGQLAVADMTTAMEMLAMLSYLAKAIDGATLVT